MRALEARLFRVTAVWACVGALAACGGEDASPERHPADVAETSIEPVTPESAPLVALTPSELNQTYRDLLGMPMEADLWPEPPAIAERFKGDENETLGIFGSQPIKPPPWPWVFPAEAGEDGFEGIATGQEPSPLSVETLQKAATHFATYALVSDTFFHCTEGGGAAPEDPEGVYWSDVRPILAGACGGCHSGDQSGGSDFASVYEDNLKDSDFCVGQQVGDCILERIEDGTMPPANAKNVTPVSAEDRALLEAWVGAGMPQAPPGVIPWSELADADRDACGLASVQRFAERAWRRPLDDGERDRLSDLWAQLGAESTREEAVVLAVAAILQSPAFLYRIEAGDLERAQGEAVPLTDYEMASRLSYFLWDSMPDETLFAAAAAGELRSAEQVEDQARRMLQDDRARAMVVRFHDQWLETDRVQGISPARRVYGPAFGLTPEPPLDTTGDQDWPSVLGPIRHSLEAETRLFVERTIFDGAGTLRALLTDNHGYMSEASEPLYGDHVTILPGPTVTWEYGIVVASQPTAANLVLYPVELPASERAGLLTLPSVLALGAYAVHPAPILRGKRILERVICQELGTPPPNADAAAPPDTETADATNRERTEVATSPPECIGCHTTLNPPGFAFEGYDAMGRFRTEDNGLPIDASGVFTVMGGETFVFEDGVDLAHQLATSDRVHDCYSLRWARYATGVHLEEDAPGLDALQERFRSNDRVRELLVGIATSDMFRFLPREALP